MTPKEVQGSDYAREALSEWGHALRYGTRAVVARWRERRTDKPPLRERLNPAQTEKGGRLGDAADAAFARLGKPGKAASKLSLGSRMVERVRGSSGEAADGAAEEAGTAPAAAADSSGGNGTVVPIEESIHVAVPIDAVYELATRFEDYPEFLDRVEGVEEVDDSHVTFVAKVHGRDRELPVEIVEEIPERRIDWECAEGVAHVGLVTFHELAPRLTDIELTVEVKPASILDRITRSTHFTQRAMKSELRRFKVHAELSEEGIEAYEREDEEEPEERGEPENQEDLEDEEEPDEDEDLEDEEELEDDEELVAEDEGDLEDEELEDDEDLEDEEESDDEELEEDELDEEELEPAR